MRRRELLRLAGAGACTGLMAGCTQAPLVVPRPPDARAPRALWGVQAGDVTDSSAIVWCKADRPARIVVDWATAADFTNARRVEGGELTAETDFTGRVELSALPKDAVVHYRVYLLGEGGLVASEPAFGRFRLAPRARRDVSFVWGADTCGQGFGIDESRGGLLTYESMRKVAPDFFVHAGDLIYADNPILPSMTLEDGTEWRNVSNALVAKPAESLEEFRARFAYALTDRHVQRFNAEVPSYVLWDDHEVINNWYPDLVLADERYVEKRAAVLAERARRALFEFTPVRRNGGEARRLYRAFGYGPSVDLFLLDGRTYRGPNGTNRDAKGEGTRCFGEGQLDWLKRNLVESKATWKVLVSGQPIGLVVPGDVDKVGGRQQDGIANGDASLGGRELEIADLLRFLKEEGIANVVFLTGDVHYAAALRYDPSRARVKEFTPFWEFVAGPLHAGTFGPNPTDPTFGPEVVFQKVPEGGKKNLPPSAGAQFFGSVKVDGRTDALTVALHDRAGTAIYSTKLAPGPR